MKKPTISPTKLSYRFKLWLVAVVASAVFVGFGYTAVQQNYRLTANNVLVQSLEQVDNYLAQGAAPEQIASSQSPVDPSKSLSPFVIMTDENGKLQASNMQLGASQPVPPKGALEATKNGGENDITWAPQKGTRVAVVIKHFKSDKQAGYIIVGSSLREVEKHINQLTLFATATFVLLAILAAIAIRLKPTATTPFGVPVTPEVVSASDLQALEATASTEVATDAAKPKKTPAKKAKTTKKPTSKKPAKKSPRA